MIYLDTCIRARLKGIRKARRPAGQHCPRMPCKATLISSIIYHLSPFCSFLPVSLQKGMEGSQEYLWNPENQSRELGMLQTGRTWRMCVCGCGLCQGPQSSSHVAIVTFMVVSGSSNLLVLSSNFISEAWLTN